MSNIKKISTLFLVGGMVYYFIEIMFRGYSHPTMFVLGGICFLLIGYLNETTKYRPCLIKQGLIGSSIITTMEFVFGVIFNIILKWDIWDYSDVAFNVLGQICLPFSIAWIGLSIIAVFVDDYLRYIWFGETIPVYHWFK